MMGFFDPLADVLSHDGNRARLRVDRRLPLDRDSHVKLVVQGQAVVYTVRAHSLERQDVAFVCDCTLKSPDQIPVGRDPEAPDQRSDPRTGRHIRVLSRELDGYEAVSLDLSMGGMKIMTSGPLDLDELLLVELEPQTELAFACEARVCWCRDFEEGYMVGLRFERVPRDARKRLLALCRVKT